MSMLLNERIKAERQKLKISQLKLGELLSVSQQAVGKWEKGIAEPDSHNLVRLADLFNISVDTLLDHATYKTEIATDSLLRDDEQLLLDYYRRLVPKNKTMLFNLMKNIFEEARDLPTEQAASWIRTIN